MTLEVQSRDLRIVAVITIALGLLIALSAYPPLNGVTIWLADIIVWPMDGAQSGEDSVARLMLAIGGGVLTGFGAIWFAAAGALLRKAPHETRRVLIAGALAWFVTDSTGSVLADAAANVIPNIGFLALLLWPLRRPAKD